MRVKRETPVTPAEQIVAALAAFGPSYLRWVESRMRASGISFSRARLVGVLGIRSPRMMSELSDELNVTRHNITVLVDALERDGIVRRRAHPTDRRATLVSLTEKGRNISTEAFPEGVSEVSELFETLSKRDQREFLRIVHSLRAELQKRDDAAEERPARTRRRRRPLTPPARSASRRRT